MYRYIRPHIIKYGGLRVHIFFNNLDPQILMISRFEAFFDHSNTSKPKRQTDGQNRFWKCVDAYEEKIARALKKLIFETSILCYFISISPLFSNLFHFFIIKIEILIVPGTMNLKTLKKSSNGPTEWPTDQSTDKVTYTFA